MRIINQRKGLMTIKEVCEMFQITRQTLYNWTKGGLIQAYRVVRKVYYKPDEIESALKKAYDGTLIRKNFNIIGGKYEHE